MDRARRGRATAASVAAVFVLSICGTASAALPRPGARYLLPVRFDADPSFVVHAGALQVGSDGRSIVPDGLPLNFPYYFASSVPDTGAASYIAMLVECPYAEEYQAVFNVAGTTGIPIGASGRFHTSALSLPDDTGSGVLRLHGQFLSRGSVDISISGGEYTPTTKRACPIGRRRFHFQVRQLPPFPSCRQAPGKTVAIENQARVFTNWGTDELGKTRYAYGCIFGGQRIVLGRAARFNNDFPILFGFQLAGTYVAYKRSYNGGDFSDIDDLTVADLAGGGSVVYHTDYPVPGGDEGTNYNAVFSQVLLTPRGSAAWIAGYCPAQDRGCDAGLPPRFVYEVWIADAAGARRVDSGPKIGPTSLAVAGPTVSWTNDGAPESAAIG